MNVEDAIVNINCYCDRSASLVIFDSNSVGVSFMVNLENQEYKGESHIYWHSNFPLKAIIFHVIRKKYE